MKFSIETPINRSIIDLMRRMGYHFQKQDPNSGELAFTRSIQGTMYPRFHIYIRESREKNGLEFNLHLDQKRPVYQGAPAHSGEYSSKPVEEEIRRIKKILRAEGLE